LDSILGRGPSCQILLLLVLVLTPSSLQWLQAYLRGQIDPGYAPIIKAVVSIIFLSTPHRGTNLAETLNRILQVSFAGSPMQFISELSAGSQTIRSLNEDFRHIAPKLNIYSFYETQPTPLVGSSKIKTVRTR
jgi:hypothetical protein